MNKIICFCLFLGAMASCTKTETLTPAPQTIITTDSSQFNGRLKVVVLDGTNNNTVLNGAQVLLYPSYDDLKRNLYLNNITTENGEADFGYLLQGNYYLRAKSGNKADTNVVQVLGQKVISRTLIVRQ